MRDMSPREEEYKQKGVEFLAINAFEPPEKGKAFIEASGLHYRWAFADEAATEAFGVSGVPCQMLVDREGRIVWTSSLTTIPGGADVIFEEIDKQLGLRD